MVKPAGKIGLTACQHAWSDTLDETPEALTESVSIYAPLRMLGARHMLLIELHNPGSLHSFIHTWHESDGFTAVMTALRADVSFTVTFPEPCGQLYKITALLLGPLKYLARGIYDEREVWQYQFCTCTVKN